MRSSSAGGSAPIVQGYGGVIFSLHGHGQSPFTGGDVLRAQILQHPLGEAQVRQMGLGLRHRGVGRRVRRLPVHGVAPPQEIAQEEPQGQAGREPAHQPPVRQADPPRRRGVAVVVQDPEGLIDPVEQPEIHRQQDPAQKNPLVFQQPQEKDRCIPGHHGPGALGAKGEAGPFCQGLEPLPKADQQGQEQQVAGQGQEKGQGGIGKPNGGVQNQGREEAEGPQQGKDPAGPEPGVFPGHGAKAQEEQHHPHRGQQVVQTPEIQGEGAENNGGEEVGHGGLLSQGWLLLPVLYRKQGGGRKPFRPKAPPEQTKPPPRKTFAAGGDPSIAQLFSHQDHLGLLGAAHGTPEDRQAVADPVGAFAVVALELLFQGAGGLALEPAGVQGGGHVPGPPEGFVKVLGHLVDPHQVADQLMGPQGGGDPVAGAVDID